MFANVAYALLGAIFGMLLAYLPAIWSHGRKYLHARRKSRAQQLMASGSVDRWLTAYYDQRGVPLFYCALPGASKYIPFISDASWIFSKRVNAQGEWLIHVLPERATPYTVDERLLERRRRMGAVLFQSWRKSLCLDSVSLPPAKLSARPCEYFEIASALIQLEDETYSNAAREQRKLFRGRRKSPIRDTYLPGFPHTATPWPFSIGCHTVLALKSQNSYELVIQTRGEAVITYPNAKAAIPNFGFEPNSYRSGSSAYGCIFYNFMREYLEELFNYEEIIGRTTWSHDPDFLFELPEARTLMDAYQANQFELTFLGAGIECLSGTFTIALIARIENQEVIGQLRRNIAPNYEVATATTSRTPIEFIDIADPRLGHWLNGDQFQPSSAFAVSLAVQQLAAEP